MSTPPHFMSWPPETFDEFFALVAKGGSTKAQAALVNLTPTQLKEDIAKATEAEIANQQDDQALALAEFSKEYRRAQTTQETKALDAINLAVQTGNTTVALQVLKAIRPERWDRATFNNSRVTAAKINALDNSAEQQVLLPDEVLAALPPADRAKIKQILAKNNLALLERAGPAKSAAQTLDDAMKLLNL